MFLRQMNSREHVGRLGPLANAVFATATVLVSAGALAAQTTAPTGPAAPPAAAAPIAVAPKSVPGAQLTEVSRSSSGINILPGNETIFQLSKPTPVKAGETIAKVELYFGIAGSCIDVRVTNITKKGIGIASRLGMLMTEQGPKPLVTVGYGDTMSIGVGLSNWLKVKVEKGAGDTALVTAVFMPSYVTQTYKAVPGAMLPGQPALTVTRVVPQGVEFASAIFPNHTMRLRYGQPGLVELSERSSMGIGVRKGSADTALVYITRPDSADPFKAAPQPPVQPPLAVKPSDSGAKAGSDTAHATRPAATEAPKTTTAPEARPQLVERPDHAAKPHEDTSWTQAIEAVEAGTPKVATTPATPVQTAKPPDSGK